VCSSCAQSCKPCGFSKTHTWCYSLHLNEQACRHLGTLGVGCLPLRLLVFVVDWSCAHGDHSVSRVGNFREGQENVHQLMKK